MSLKAPNLILPNNGTLLDIAVEIARNHPDIFEDPNDRERTLLVVGSESVGKTKLMNNVLELDDEEVLPTMLLGYLSATRDAILDNQGNNTCHVWELAGIGRYASVLDIIRDIPNPSAIVMVNLSKPEFLWYTIKSTLDVITNFIGHRMDVQQTQAELKASLPEDYPDREGVQPFSIPLIIIGGKYELFQSFEPEKKKVISKFLRFITHYNCGFLFFYGETKDKARLIKRAKDVLHHYAFGAEKYDGLILDDYNSPIVIPPGKDHMNDIEPNFGRDHSISKYLHMLELHFPQEDPLNVQLPDDPTYDENFKETRIDALRKQKDEEFELYVQEKERKQKLQDELGLDQIDDLSLEESLKWDFKIQ